MFVSGLSSTDGRRTESLPFFLYFEIAITGFPKKLKVKKKKEEDEEKEKIKENEEIHGEMRALFRLQRYFSSADELYFSSLNFFLIFTISSCIFLEIDYVLVLKLFVFSVF